MKGRCPPGSGNKWKELKEEEERVWRRRVGSKGGWGEEGDHVGGEREEENKGRKGGRGEREKEGDQKRGGGGENRRINAGGKGEGRGRREDTMGGGEGEGRRRRKETIIWGGGRIKTEGEGQQNQKEIKRYCFRRTVSHHPFCL